jgi:hypothetical protein
MIVGNANAQLTTGKLDVRIDVRVEWNRAVSHRFVGLFQWLRLRDRIISTCKRRRWSHSIV